MRTPNSQTSGLSASTKEEDKDQVAFFGKYSETDYFSAPKE